MTTTENGGLPKKSLYLTVVLNSSKRVPEDDTNSDSGQWSSQKESLVDISTSILARESLKLTITVTVVFQERVCS